MKTTGNRQRPRIPLQAQQAFPFTAILWGPPRAQDQCCTSTYPYPRPAWPPHHGPLHPAWRSPDLPHQPRSPNLHHLPGWHSQSLPSVHTRTGGKGDQEGGKAAEEAVGGEEVGMDLPTQALQMGTCTSAQVCWRIPGVSWCKHEKHAPSLGG
ncbi:hypothetical protein ACKKBF_B40120 [Auxenochlorella protothecoides x Auxenochlorella symbiontica]